MSKAHYSEFRKDGWPLCPNCGEDELHDSCVWTGEGPRPTVDECMAGVMRCYQCNWASDAPGVGCGRCNAPVSDSPRGGKYYYCDPCREIIGAETIRAEVEKMDWPDIIG